ncbi:MAG: hypothetical protein ACOCZE_12405, partial [Planctomycetota bacterium]
MNDRDYTIRNIDARAILLAALPLVCAVLAGCELTIDGQPVFGKQDLTSKDKETDALYEQGTGVLEDGREVRTFESDASQLAIWRDPQFRKDFMDSYIAVTEVEPPVAEVDKPVLQEILLLMNDGKTEQAIARLEEIRGPDATPQFDFLLGNLYLQREAPEGQSKPDSDYKKAAAAFTV